MTDKQGDPLFCAYKTKDLSIVGYPHHFVSDCGKFFTRKIRGSYSLLETPRRIKTGFNFGYELVTITHGGESKTFRAHRLVALCFIGVPLEDQTQVNHIDGDKANNQVSNLEWCTPRENMHHAHIMGLNNRKGSRNGGAKLNEEKVSRIKLFIEMGHTNKDLSLLFGVANNTISGIRTGLAWKHTGCGRL